MRNWFVPATLLLLILVGYFALDHSGSPADPTTGPEAERARDEPLSGSRLPEPVTPNRAPSELEGRRDERVVPPPEPLEVSLARVLGWEADSPEAERLGRWLDDHHSRERAWRGRASTDAEQLLFAAQRFNENAAGRAKALVEAFGGEAAARIAREVELHHVDPASGALVRVTLEGERSR